MTSPPTRTYYYTTPTYAPAQVAPTTSRIEIRDIAIAFAVLTLDLMLILSSTTFLSAATGLGGLLSVTTFAIAATAAVTGFLAHELAHKFAAQRHGAWAEFRMSPVGLVVSVVTAVVGFLFAAPGATVVGGMTDLREWGRTALAGPMTNLAFAAAFFVGAVGAGAAHLSTTVTSGLVLLTFFNGWFGAFNLLPFGPLDGAKVLHWSTPTWAVTFVACGAVTVVAALGFIPLGL